VLSRNGIHLGVAAEASVTVGRCWSLNTPSVAKGYASRLAKALATRTKTSAHAGGVSMERNSIAQAGHWGHQKARIVSFEEVVKEAGGRDEGSCRLTSCPPSWAGASPFRAGL
jgi:hypothetical protein